ncbi:hypothetical protein NQ318_008491 [Aromia moschata]|uniref:Uncharacterized protein n=1 Tax=Aromia moschata TaxID=1265417 RepID=A0AAV8XB40_9CUCU|nr:hypothetical protein NQ318_008491 [Aromia moschata]
MIMLIKSNWKYEISHHAANNLHSKKMNSIGIVPLASDLKKFKDYLKTTANSAAAKLQSDCNDRDAYKTLQQTVYCRIMLLCRKRPGELARLTVDLYNEGKEAQTYEEFENKIRPSERILMRKFKRVVIKGKRKATPVLFSLDVQEHIQILLDLRSNFTSQNDPYIFSKLISREPFRGYQVLMHHAKMAGLKNPDAIKSRGLRKHLATISQLFSMENEDVEQLATFMGHTLDVHRKEYRLPDDIFQTAKIAKLLLLMESGDAGKYQGKTLDEINLEEDLMNPEKNNETSEEDVSDEEGELLQQIKCTPQISNKVEQKKEVATVKKRVLTKWSDRQKQVALNFFKEHIKQKKPPKRDECAKLKELNGDLFNNKDWLKIKVFIQNIYTNKLKK